MATRPTTTSSADAADAIEPAGDEPAATETPADGQPDEPAADAPAEEPAPEAAAEPVAPEAGDEPAADTEVEAAPEETGTATHFLMTHPDGGSSDEFETDADTGALLVPIGREGELYPHGFVVIGEIKLEG